MKQNEIIINEKYFFRGACADHKKHMLNKVFTVIKRIKGKKKITGRFSSDIGKKPDKFLLCNGEYANASNLKIN